MPFDLYFTSDGGKKRKGRRPFRIGVPPAIKMSIEQHYGPKISQDDWRAMTHAEKMAHLSTLPATGENGIETC